MKRFIYLILLAVTMSFHYPLEGFLDAFVVYGKRNNNIKKVFLNALNTKEKKWREDGLAYPRDTYMSFTFVPENQNSEQWHNNWDLSKNEMFEYTEYNLKKDSRDIRDISSFVAEIAHYEKDHPDWRPLNIIFQNDSEIRFEAFIESKQHPWELHVHKPEGVQVEKKIRTNASRHILCKAVHLGGVKFIEYKYQMKNRELSQAEKDFWFQMFDYMRIDF